MGSLRVSLRPYGGEHPPVRSYLELLYRQYGEQEREEAVVMVNNLNTNTFRF